jgi:hypothetical protein
MVSNGLNKAPVARVARLLEVLRVAQQKAGGSFINHYANVGAGFLFCSFCEFLLFGGQGIADSPAYSNAVLSH